MNNKEFEEWFTQFKKDNYLHETDWGSDAKKSVARECAEAAAKHFQEAGQRQGMECAAEIGKERRIKCSEDGRRLSDWSKGYIAGQYDVEDSIRKEISHD